MTRRRIQPVLAACATALALAACGGGISIGWGGDFDDAPSVSLAASVSAAHVGDSIRLVAAASDDFRVDRVEFFRIEDDGSATRLAIDGDEPYQWDTTLPSTSAAVVRYFARAVDDVGQFSDSAQVVITVLR
jgi:hypothetical protein